MSETSEFIAVHTLSNRFEADLLMDTLKKEGIPAMMRSFEETPYDGLFVCQKGWGQILVPRDSSSHAKEIIKPLIEELKGRNLFSDPSEIDPVLWERLRQASPDVICRNAQVSYNPETSSFVVPFLNAEFSCSPEQESIEPLDPVSWPCLDFTFYLAMLHYLLEAQPVASLGKWISEKDIPGGELFFRGHHRLPTDRLKQFFGTRPHLFRSASEMLGGSRVSMGDLAYALRVFPLVSLLLILWEGDEEFEPNFSILFDGSIHLQVHALDTLWALVHNVSKALRNAGQIAEEGMNK